RTITNWVEEFADVPRSCQWTRFRFAISDHCGDDQFGIIECSAAGMRKHVAQFAAFVDRTGGLRGAVTADPARKRELFEELMHAAGVFALFRIDLGVRTFEITGTEDAGRPMPRTCHENHVQV